MHKEPRYRRIADYAIIGDCHAAALVSMDGSIDWATLHRFDEDPVCCRLLDADKGGYWSIRPVDAFTTTRAYLDKTNVLRTEFETASGRVAITDLMPVGRALDAGTHDYVQLAAPGWIMRRIEGLEGEVRLKLAYRPAVDFGATDAVLEAYDGSLRVAGVRPRLFSDLDYSLDGSHAEAHVDVGPGDQHDHVLAATWVDGVSPLTRVSGFLDVTVAFWTEWSGYCRYDGPYRATMERSALVLKLLSYAPSGAIIAAPTTSLPEDIGGVRNWDYRYCWVRDGAFALYALAILGYSGEVERFHEFIAKAATASLPNVQPMYGIDGTLELDERELSHLTGYRDSAPVRVGNDAWRQRQIDNFGHLLELAKVYTAVGGELDASYRRLLEAAAAFVETHWELPDESLWEMRGAPLQHVHAKLMCWVAMDRAADVLEDERWREVAVRIRRSIDANALTRRGLEQTYEGGVDAATLLAPLLGYPAEQEVFEATIDTVKSELGSGDFLSRYVSTDGVDGDEGAFLLCSCWLADAELAVGRIDEARARIERFIERANDVGLYAEEIDPASGEFLGNFPQAFTHLGLIGNLVNLALVERHGVEGLAGGYAARADRAVTASFGWRGLLAATMQSKRMARLVSSDASKLAWP